MNKTLFKYLKLICILFIPITFFALILEVQVGDELFNFQSIVKITNGYMLYKDFNVIVTPIFFIFGAIMQKIFGDYLIVFRIYNIIICFLFYISFYNLLEEVGISSKFIITGLLIGFIFTMNIIYSGANYNVLATTFYMIGIIYLLKEKNKKTPFILGIVAYLCFMTKQNIGVFFILGLITSQIIILKKDCIKDIFIQLLTFLFFITCSIFIFLINGNFYDFLNYTFFNIADFSKNNFQIILDKENIVYLISIIIINLVFILRTIYNKDNNCYIISIFSIFFCC